ncbi:hypothetical protein [Nitrospirillum viridazoti]|uniref:Uncharacterized protein n=1 Tax=Nitrospirillum viridazoti CBAmc TaxID=1441467 RepID=A0A248JWD3_9PROT|nr:hypothetical protein [Nitrospirillum amazonense]ASG23015.1 hypothetical protein Y958_19265 [Nitrospirillum amazonense CBAmc]TWB38731.1 hypothetical protein FBZ91_10657 [Nitrospirillum amazonense]
MIFAARARIYAFFTIFALAGAGSAMAAGVGGASSSPCGPAPVLSLKHLDAPPAAIDGDAFVAHVKRYAAKAKARGACLAQVAANSGTTSPAMAPAPSGD